MTISTLSHPSPRMTTEAHERVEVALRGACSGWGCGYDRAAIVKRMVNGWTVHVQCLRCGRSRSGALKRAEFPTWETFEEWDAERVENWQSSRRHEAVEALANRNEEVARRLAEQSATYREWLRTSPEWADVRVRVLKRSGYICESCLNARATDAHHVTYADGLLPPAWEMRAVCRKCHDAIHNGWPQAGTERDE